MSEEPEIQIEIHPLLKYLSCSNKALFEEYLSDPSRADVVPQLVTQQIEGSTAPLVHLALFFNRLEILQILFHKYPASMLTVDAEGSNLLHLCLFHNRELALPLLMSNLEEHPEYLSSLLSGKDSLGYNIIHKAVFGNAVNCLNTLYPSLKSDPSLLLEMLQAQSADDGFTPLHLAALRAEPAFVDLLLKIVSEIPPSDQANPASVLDCPTPSTGSTALHLAVVADRPAVVTKLVAAGASISVQDKYAQTPVHYAVRQNNQEVVNCFLPHLTDSQLSKEPQLTVLHYACSSGNAQLTRSLLRLPFAASLFFAKSPSGDSALHLAAWFGHLDCLTLLLEFLSQHPPEDPALRQQLMTNNELATPVHFAAYRGHHTVLQLLNQDAFPMAQLDDEHETPLHKACSQGHSACVKYLLDLAPSAQELVSVADVNGFTSLHLAVLNDHAETIRVLLASGASPNLPNQSLFTPFHLSILRSSPAIVGMLMRESAAAFHGSAMFEQLASETRLSPLHLACSATSRETMQLLFDLAPQFCNSNARDLEEMTPLHYAFLFGRTDLIPLLMTHGGDPYLVDRNGNDALQKSPLSPDEVADILNQGKALKRAQVQKKWRAVAVTFNQKPKAGIEEGVQRGLIENTPEDIARFLYECDHLQKALVGEYIGDHKEFHIQVLDCYASLFSFEGLPFDAALRLYLSKFRLPGEAQKIERLVERFARRYNIQNPGIFHHEDGAFILSYSTIMLNTDAHNPQVKNKMTKEQFIKTNRGIDDGHDIPREFLEKLYDSITNEAIKMEGEGELRLFQAAEKKGWMRKQGGRVKTWKRRWFVLSANCVYYFKFPEDKEPLGIIPLENLDIRPVNAKKFEFEIFSPQKLAQSPGSEGAIKAVKSGSGKGMEKGHHDRYLLSASSLEEMDSWIACIKTHIIGNPVYLLMQSRSSKSKASPSSSIPATLGSSTNLLSSSSSPSIPSTPSSSTTTATTSSTSSSSASSIPLKKEPPGPGIAELDLSFKELFFAVIACLALQTNSLEDIKRRFPTVEFVIETSAPDLQVMIATNHQQREQCVVVHRAAWDDLDMFAKVLHTAKVTDSKPYEISKISEHIFTAIIQRHLLPDFSLSFIGDGLGGCHAIEVWMRVRKQLKAQHKIITIGQPLHPLSLPSKTLKSMPLIRILNDTDPVIYLFSGVDPYGSEVILMKQGLFSLIVRPSRPKVPITLTLERARDRAPSHLLSEYFQRTESCLVNPTRVNVDV